MIGESLLYSFLETFCFYRLDQIVDGIDFITIQCIFRISSGEDDKCSFGDSMCELLCGDTGHLDIQKDQVDRMFFHKPCGGHCIVEHAQ